MIYSDFQIATLECKVSSYMSEKRFTHTLGVKKIACFLGSELGLDTSELMAAALLHDIAKEMSLDEQIDMLERSGFTLTEEDRMTPGIIHSFSGPLIVKRDFPDFATPKILNSIFVHTVGSSTMSIFDKIIFISDYTEENRIYASCISVRNLLLNGFDKLTYEEKLRRVDEACVASLEGVFDAIKKAGRMINSRMITTINSFNS